MTGELPQIDHYKVWGCPAIERMEKWQLRPHSGTLFVGYPTDGPGYLLYDVHTKHLRVRKNVVFDENFSLRTYPTPGLPHDPNIPSDVFYYDPLYKHSVLESPRVQHAPPEEMPNQPDQELRPTPVQTLYGFAVDLAEIPQLTEYDAAVAVEENQDAHQRSVTPREDDCEVTLNPTLAMQDMEVEATSEGNTEAQGMSTRTTTSDRREAGSATVAPDKRPRREMRWIPHTSESSVGTHVHKPEEAEKALVCVYPIMDSVMSSRFVTPSKRLCQLGVNHTLYGLHSQRALVAHYVNQPLILHSMQPLSLPPLPVINYADLDLNSITSVDLQEALEGPESANWIQAMREEHAQLDRLHCWTVVHLPLDDPSNIVDTKWILRKKYANGKFERYKARLVVRGFTQVKGVDYEDTYAPVGMAVSIRLFLTLVAVYALFLFILDVRNAYIQAAVDAIIYAWPPEGFCPPQPTTHKVVYKLQKAWYGIHQAPRAWNRHLNQFLMSYGLIRGTADKCIYFKHGPGSISELMLLVVVDDMLVACPPHKQHVYHAFLAAFRAFTDVQEVTNPTSFVGLTITRHMACNQIKLSQAPYIEKILETYRPEDTRVEFTPAVKGLQLSVADCPDTDAAKTTMAKVPYRQILGKLLYLSVMTRPDISFVVNMLARFATNPSKPAWQAMKHLLRYLRHTSSLGDRKSVV